MAEELAPLEKESSGEERILVSVRLRPLNSKEIARNDTSDWECINENTIIFKNSAPDRSMLPTAYTFDRVFRCNCSTKQVYEEAAKAVALSVLNGINSSIFAYGQTSSGKTFTMSGITECTVTDIYDYIQQHEERAFILKFSALEIHNEAVRDLLSPDPTPLRLLDDPERGTTVERLTEETPRDWKHLQELLSLCEAQRQIGETCLNETSSRSHQILRLTIESSARESMGVENSSTLAASVNFVDLAGSERASQTLSAGTRLKEGCHINRSLLTLGTVIRKLSKGRNGHIPYRDSKLTRILQSSLGGNARTAIICTMSPARSHIEQSRNTLQFASCAKEVTTSAKVNVVMSDKALVKHLQRELARLESELRGQGQTSVTSHSQALLREKDYQIQNMEKEMEELIQERDHAQSRVEELLQVLGDDHNQRLWAQFSHSPRVHSPNSCEAELSLSEPSGSSHQGSYYGFSNFNTDQHSKENCGIDLDENFLEISEIPGNKFSNTSPCHLITSPGFVGSVTDQSEKDIPPDINDDSEDRCKEVRCIEESSMPINEEDFSLSPDGSENLQPSRLSYNVHATDEELVSSANGDRKFRVDSTNVPLEQKLEEGRKTMDSLKPCSDESYTQKITENLSSSEISCLNRPMIDQSSLLGLEKAEEPNVNMPPAEFDEHCHGRSGDSHIGPCAFDHGREIETFSRDHSQISEHNATSDMQKAQHIKNSSETNIPCIQSSVAGLKGMAELHYQEKLVDDLEANPKVTEDLAAEKTKKDMGLDPILTPLESPSHWTMEFGRQQREIIELWEACNVSLIHRTYFFLLFKGDPTDSIYMEVELRRLSFLKNMFSQEKLGKPAVEDGRVITHASSMKALQRERELLSKQMQKSFTVEERNNLYQKLGIGLDTKQRKLQLACRLWTETGDMDHIRESAAIVAKLIGFLDQGQAFKEMFSLSFTPQLASGRSYGWFNSRSYFGTSYP